MLHKISKYTLKIQEPIGNQHMKQNFTKNLTNLKIHDKKTGH